MNNLNLLKRFIAINFEINNWELFLNCFGQRYIILKQQEINKIEPCSELLQLDLLFRNLGIYPINNKGNIEFKKIKKNKFKQFLRKIKEEF